jgi:hypothetical protein
MLSQEVGLCVVTVCSKALEEMRAKNKKTKKKRCVVRRRRRTSCEASSRPHLRNDNPSTAVAAVCPPPANATAAFAAFAAMALTSAVWGW